MPFADLEHLSLGEFIERERIPNALLLFIHIPKTAGSSLTENLCCDLSPYSSIYVDQANLTGPYDQELSNVVQRFLANPHLREIRSASGHVPWSLAKAISERLPDSRIVTILRDPIERVVSDYRYQKSPAHPKHLEFRRAHPTIQSYLDDFNEANKMFRFMTDEISFGSGYEAIGKSFTFVGILEKHEKCVEVIYSLVGKRSTRIGKANVTAPTSDNTVDITPELRSHIAEVNHLDVQLYRRVSARLDRAFWPE